MNDDELMNASKRHFATDAHRFSQINAKGECVDGDVAVRSINLHYLQKNFAQDTKISQCRSAILNHTIGYWVAGEARAVESAGRQVVQVRIRQDLLNEECRVIV